MDLGIIVTIVALLVIAGAIERKRAKRNAYFIRTRICVNGIRGKSTTTRLIYGILKESGKVTVGKTTGTSPQFILPDGSEERIKRRPEGANIKEMLSVIDKSVSLGAEAIVAECMAINPDYQKIFQEQMLFANICIITNVWPDHLDVLGPTTREVAEAFAQTIPKKGYLIITEGPYKELFYEAARRKSTKVFVADSSIVPRDYLQRFSYTIFPDNIALALTVAEVLCIDKDVALRGMLNTTPDPGALRLTKKGGKVLVSAFAANDPTSCIAIFAHLKKLGLDTYNATIILNCRGDRPQRTKQFVDSVLPFVGAKTLLAIGSGTYPVTAAWKKNKLRFKSFQDMENKSADEIFKHIEESSSGVVIGIGNTYGVGEELMRHFTVIQGGFKSAV